MKTEVKTAVIYSRVSTQEQDYQSQIDVLTKYAKDNDIKIVTEPFAERVSGYNLKVKRTEFDNMKAYVLANNIKLILCWELSRFGRNSLHTQNEIDNLKKQNIAIYFKKENISTLSDDPTSVLLLSLLASIAQMEWSTIKANGIRGRDSAAKNRKRIGFPIMPYGFTADEKGFIIINEVEAVTVRMIYELYSNGMGSGGIAEKLNLLNISTRNTLRGKERTTKKGEQVKILWRPNTIRKILKSTLYKGKRTYKLTTIIDIPRIVTDELWDKVQENFESNLGYVNATKYEYLFKGKIYCGDCELMYKSESRDYKTYIASYYSCYGRKDKGIKCKNGQIRSKFFDDKVYDLLFRHKDVMLKVYNDKAKTFKVEEKKADIVYYENLIEKQEKRRRTIIGLLKEDEIEKNEFDADNRKIKSEILRLQGNIRTINKEIESFSDLNLSNTLTSLLTETNFNIKREFILKYVDKIKVYKVNQTNIDFEKLSYTEMKTMKTQAFRAPVLNDKLTYVEIYAFGNTTPLKLVLSSLTDICYTNSKLTYIMGYLSIDEK